MMSMMMKMMNYHVNDDDGDDDDEDEMLACRSSGNPGSWQGLQGLQPLVRDVKLFELLRVLTVQSTDVPLLLLLLPIPSSLIFSLSDQSLISKLNHSWSNSAAVKNWTRAQSAMKTVVMMELAMWKLAMKAIVRTGASDG